MKMSYFTKNLTAVFIIVTVFLLYSCSARTQDPFAGDPKARAFDEAGLPLLSRQISLRDFSLPTLEGELKSLNDYRGKLVFLNFWATWCPPCRDEMPSMEALYQRFKERGLEIIAVNIGESQSEVLAFMQEYGLSFPTLLDEDGKVAGDYGIMSIPTSFFIDQEGNVILRKVGSIDWDTAKVRAALELLLD